jgi:N-acetylmuramoyl-L-alanine amidase
MEDRLMAQRRLPCILGWTLAGIVEVPPAQACEPAEFAVAIDVGHDRVRSGTVSARGVPEFEFNLALAREVVARLVAAGFSRAFLIGEDRSPLALRERTAIAERAGARAFISIHHDSVQPQYLERWTFEGRMREHTTHARGFSLFVSAANGFFATSKELALRIGAELRAGGSRPSVHHAEPIEGENREVIDRPHGVYRFNELVVLRCAAIPAVLLEAGVIKHREEELVVASATFRAEVAGAIRRAFEQAVPARSAGSACAAPRIARPRGRSAERGRRVPRRRRTRSHFSRAHVVVIPGGGVREGRAGPRVPRVPAAAASPG